jgi:hypothetical protein
MMLLQQLALMIVPISITWQGITMLFIEIVRDSVGYSSLANFFNLPSPSYSTLSTMSTSTLSENLLVPGG